MTKVYISKVDQEKYLKLAKKLREEAYLIEHLIELVGDKMFPINVENIITWEKLDITLKETILKN